MPKILIYPNFDPWASQGTKNLKWKILNTDFRPKIMFQNIVWKRKNTILKMSLKSSIMSKFDHQMSRIWIEVAGRLLETISNLTGWKTEYLIAQLRIGIRQKSIRLKTCPQGVLQAQHTRLNWDIGVHGDFWWKSGCFWY